jgi:glucose/arabinose dehydrogenase
MSRARARLIETRRVFTFLRLSAALTCLALAACGLQPGNDRAPQATAPIATIVAPATGLPATPTTELTPAAEATPTPAQPETSTPRPDPTATVEPTPTPTQAAPSAADIDPGAYTLERVAAGFDQPLLLTHDGSDRLFVGQQPGLIHSVQAGAVLPEPFLDIRGRVNSQAYERGLLGLAFHPDYAHNGYFFVHYTGRNGDTIVSHFRVSEDPTRADPESEQILLEVRQPYPNHNGGHLAFGPDGYLYVSLGDGGSAGDPHGHAQNLGTLLGTLLRLDVHDVAAGAYTIPPDNPFIERDDARNEIWAYGLRNPWRFSFDRLTGDLYIADVGQNAFEEVNFQPADSAGGENYGWNYMEGFAPFRGQPPAGVTLVPPVVDYPLDRPNCAVTGGYVYRGSALPALNGVYFYGDYCSGRIWWLLRDPASGEWQSELFMQTDLRISSFGQDAAGELYVVDHNGAIYRLVAR